MKTSRTVALASMVMAVGLALAGCTASSPQASPSPTAESREAQDTIKGTRLCFATASVTGMEVRGAPG